MVQTHEKYQSMLAEFERDRNALQQQLCAIEGGIIGLRQLLAAEASGTAVVSVGEATVPAPSASASIAAAPLRKSETRDAMLFLEQFLRDGKPRRVESIAHAFRDRQLELGMEPGRRGFIADLLYRTTNQNPDGALVRVGKGIYALDLGRFDKPLGAMSQQRLAEIL